MRELLEFVYIRGLLEIVSCVVEGAATMCLYEELLEIAACVVERVASDCVFETVTRDCVLRVSETCYRLCCVFERAVRDCVLCVSWSY